MGMNQSPTLDIPLWLCNPSWILQLWSLSVMSRIEYSCSPCKAPFQGLELYQWPLRAAVGEEGMPTFSCSFQAGSWRLGCRGRWCFQQLPVETAALLVIYRKMGLLLAWEVCTEPKPSKKKAWAKMQEVCGFHAQVLQQGGRGSTVCCEHKGRNSWMKTGVLLLEGMEKVMEGVTGRTMSKQAEEIQMGFFF